MIYSKVSSNFFYALALTTAAIPRYAAVTVVAVDDAARNQIKNVRDLASTKTYLVTFVDDSISPAKQCEALAKSTGASVDHVYDYVLNGCALTLSVTQQFQAQAAFTALSNDPSVMNVEFDQIVYAYQPSLTSESIVHGDYAAIVGSQQHQASATPATSWGLDRIDQCALPLNNLMTKQDATGVKVFIMDTGIRGDHAEFANGVISTDDCHFSAIAGETALVDGNGHG